MTELNEKISIRFSVFETPCRRTLGICPLMNQSAEISSPDNASGFFIVIYSIPLYLMFVIIQHEP